MNTLSDVTKQCASEMPMLLDSLQSTIREIEQELMPYFKKMKRAISAHSDKITLSGEEGLSIELFCNNTGADILNTSPELHIWQRLWFHQKRKSQRSKYIFQSGYEADSDFNCIYFALFDDESVVTLFDQDFYEEVCSNVNNKWTVYYPDDETIQFHINPTDNLTPELIAECFADFIKYVLHPLISKLQ